MIDSIGKRIKALRESIKKTQEEFSSDIGIARSQIARYETDVNNPADDIKIKLFERYNLNITWLLTGKGSMFFTHNDKPVEQYEIELYEKEKKIIELERENLNLLREINELRKSQNK